MIEIEIGPKLCSLFVAVLLLLVLKYLHEET